MVKVREDMTGWNMWEHGVPDSMLTVVSRADDYISPKGKHEAQWLCRCNCKDNKEIIVKGCAIKSGHTKSCGCLQLEIGSKLRKTNKFILNLQDDYGIYGIGYCTNTESIFYFDMEDYDKIKNYCWTEDKSNENYHTVRATINGKRVRMHVFLGYKNYDHIDRNPLNNRKYNFRSATKKENRWNSSMSKRNTSGVIGVYWDKHKKQWFAEMKKDGKNIRFYKGNSKEDAIIARLKAEKEYYGEFAPQRHLFEQYGV